MKWLALDVGDKRIGIAISDRDGSISFPRETLHRTTTKEDLKHIIDIILEEEVLGVVYGIPYHMHGEMSEQAEKIKSFIAKLEKRTRHALNLELIYDSIDERLTSVAAEKSMLSQDFSRNKRKEHIDALAAQIILQTYLERKRNEMNNHVHDENCNHNLEEFEIQRVELIDEEGNATSYVIEEWFDYNGSIYAVLVDENDEEGILFRVEEEGEETNFITPEEDEFDEVSRYYEELE